MDSGQTQLWGPEIIRIAESSLVVGRSSTAGVCLLHPAVSRQHAILRLVNTQLHVSDLGSHSGTRVNGKRVREQTLKDGDRVEFGPVAYEYRGLQLRLLLQPDGLSIESRNLAIVRGGKKLLNNVNLSLTPNQFIGILGPSGSGKTTLMKCLAGYMPPESGSLRFDGQDLPENVDSYRNIMGYVPQDDVVYKLLTGRENLDYALRLRLTDDLQPKERDDIIVGTLEQLRMSEHADKPVTVLSGGQRKRLNVAVELLSRPRILFLDEPTSGLDPAAETRLMQMLKELAARGVTVICSTHVMENLNLFDQVLVIAEQTIVYSGSPHKLLPHFRVSSYPELYQELENSSDRDLGEKQAIGSIPTVPTVDSTVLAGLQLIKPTATKATQAISRIKMTTQVSVQFLRGLQLIIRDSWLLVLLFSQPVLIGLLINLSQLRPDGLDPIFLFAAVACVWLGLNNTARDVVRDRSVYIRERLVGVTPEGYLVAKVLLYGFVGIMQVFLLLLMIRYMNFLSRHDAQKLDARSFIYLLLVLWVAYLSAMMLGLLVSTLANSEEVALAVLPLLVLPQLLLTGVATGLNSSRDGSFRSILLLFHKVSEAAPRGMMGWVLEMLSFATYTRPALSLLQTLQEQKLPVWAVRSVDWFHMFLLLLATATTLIVVFHWRERRWLEAG